MRTWSNFYLKDIADGQFGFVDGPFGSNLPASDYTPRGIPVIRGSNLTLGEKKFHDEGFIYVSESTAKRLARSICKRGDIIFTKKGTIGQIGIIPSNSRYESYLLSSNQMKLSVNKEIANNLFVYYYLSSKTSIEKIINDSEATGVPKINLGYLKNFLINLPPLEIQNRIARILEVLDDKMELNRQMNQTLEQLAQVLFKRYFEEGLSADSLPKGWSKETLGSFIETVTGFSYRSENLKPSRNALVTLKNFERNGGFRLDGFKEYTGAYKENQIVTEGDLIVAHTDVTQNAELIGNPILVINPFHYDNLIISTDCVKVIPIGNRLSKEYLYFLLRDQNFKNFCLSRTNGTTVLHLGKSALKDFSFILPPRETIFDFSSKVKSIIEKMNINIYESLLLENIRNLLLNNLMNGKIEIREVEVIVA